MGVRDMAKSVMFAIVSVLAFVMISVSMTNFVTFLSDFKFQNFADKQQNMSTQPQVAGAYLCAQPRLGTGSRFWCTLMVVIWDIFLVLVFCAQHRLMARGPFKRFLQDKLGDAYILERPLYLMTTSIVLNWMMSAWQPLDTFLWLFHPGRWHLLTLLLCLVHLLAWIVLLIETFLMDVFELLGLKQVFYYCMDMEHPLLYKTISCQRLYRRMRHPGLVCLLVVMWLYPAMSLDRYLLVSILTLFLLYGHHVQMEDYEYVVEMHDKKVLTFHSSFHETSHQHLHHR